MNRLLTILALLSFTIITSCKDIGDLSDENNVEHFSMNIYNDNIKLGNVDIDKTENVITIPVLYGTYNFPLELKIDIVTSSKVVKIFDIDFSQPIRFESIDDQKEFVVIAESGKSAKWVIRLKEHPRSDENEITNFVLSELTPEGALHCKNAMIDQAKSEVTIFALNHQFPLSFKADVEISDTAQFKGFTNGSRLSIASESIYGIIQVISSRGKERDWKIKVKTPEIVTDFNTLNRDEKTRQSLNTLSVIDFDATFLEHNTIIESYIDNRNAVINIDVKAKNSSATCVTSAKINFVTDNYAQTMGFESGQVMNFANYGEAKEFYVVDNISHKARRWSVKINNVLNKLAYVKEFEYTSRNNSGQILPVTTPGNVSYIDTEHKTIYVYVKVPYFGAIPVWGSFFITPTKLSASQGATISELKPATELDFSASLYKNGIAITKEFTVTAEDGTATKWTLAVKDNTLINTEANITSFSVLSNSPRTILVDKTGVVNAENATISVNVRDGIDQFPLTLHAKITASKFSTIVSGEFPALTFENINSTQTVTVKAENGTTEKVWTVSLNNLEPPKVADAVVYNYAISDLPNGYEFDQSKTTINAETGEIVLKMLSSGTTPLTYTHQMVLGEGAKLQDGMSNPGKLSWGSINEVKRFTVIAESGLTKEWSVRISFTPNIIGGDFETWSGIEPKGWATSNNSMVKPVKSGSPSKDNSKFCVLETIEAPIVKIASGSAFLGQFKFALTTSTPKLLTWFGIPFTGKPVSVTFDYFYTSAKDQNGADDMGSLTAQLLNYQGSAPFEFHDKNGSEGYQINESEGITKISREAIQLKQTDGWKTMTVKFNYNSELPVTHISIAFSSSWQGDSYVGGVGSKLRIDNVKLNY